MARTIAATGLLEATAYHEAGHAVIGYRFRKWIRERGIVVAPDGNGNVHLRWDVLPHPELYGPEGGAAWKAFVQRAEQEIIITLAGPLAELRYLSGRSPSGFLTGNSEDLEVVRMFMHCLGTDPNRFGEWMLHNRTRRMLREPRTWGALKALAEVLITDRSASAEKAEGIFSQWKVPRISEKAWRGPELNFRTQAPDLLTMKDTRQVLDMPPG